MAFLKFISSAEVALKNCECSHAKYLSLKNKLEKIYVDLRCGLNGEASILLKPVDVEADCVESFRFRNFMKAFTDEFY